MPKSKNLSVSFPTDEIAEIGKRVKELRLPERGGLSQYFQLLRDFDKKFKLRIWRHESDGQLHFYPPGGLEYPAAAEESEAMTRLEEALRKAEQKAALAEYPTRAKPGGAART